MLNQNRWHRTLGRCKKKVEDFGLKSMRFVYLYLIKNKMFLFFKH